jgi:hypothetical protein
MFFKQSIGFLALTIGLTGCGPRYLYTYTPPTTPEGRVCIMQCLNSQQQCSNYNQNLYQQCQNNRNWAMQNYNQCQQNAPDKKSRNHCMAPPACYAPSPYNCEENYRACYQTCGGQVETELLKD